MGRRGQGQFWDGMALRIPLSESEKICLKSIEFNELRKMTKVKLSQTTQFYLTTLIE
jgi:hypothetical protein